MDANIIMMAIADYITKRMYTNRVSVIVGGERSLRLIMGMTIDNSIRILEDSKRWRKKYGIFGSEEDDAINKLLEVAKKYQKIEQIYHMFNEVNDFPLAMWNIGGVLDGNDN